MPLTDDINELIEHETTQAQLMLRRLTEEMPKSVDAHYLLGISHLRRLEFGPARAAFLDVLKLDPKHNDALRNAAFCLLASGDYEGALEGFQHALKMTANAGSMRHVALLLHRLSRTQEAVKTYERLLSVCQPTSPEIPIALQGLAFALRDAGRPIAADQVMLQLIERFRREPVAISSGLIARNNSDDFHEWSPYADKAQLAAVLTARAAKDPGGRFPETFVLPKDRAALEAFAKRKDAPALYIVKPIRGSGGQGIRVTADIKGELDAEDVVVQRYIDRPFLIEGHKGHCRIYCLVTSASPLRAYVYSEGIVRIAPEPYDSDPAKAAGPSMHVTNTALHLGHPGLNVSTDASQDDVGSIRSLSALLRRMTAEGIDGERVFAEIKALVEWHVRMLAAEGLFVRQAAGRPARAFPPKLFGLDVLVDAEGHPWLIEMQRTPAAKGAALVEKINLEMYRTVFHMAHAPLIDDATPADRVQALRSDDAARREREAEIEMANRGKFVPLDL
ncbi:tetratricopeptide repeat protein [Phenylobacterium sp.]|uniref:tetratricopeptide repeat protein n=1 Tax=Phenylobacterium sp. TaxID=1871053 RepID=UPI002F41DEFA